MDTLKSNTVLVLALAGCLVPTVQPDGGTGTTGDGTSSPASTTIMSSAESDDPSIPGSATSPDPSGADSEGSTSSTSDTTRDTTSTGEDGTGMSGQPNGYYPCTSDDECASGHCYVILGSTAICSECESDADCEELGGFGCSPPDFASPEFAPATCGDGQLGSGCESSAACDRGFTCETVLDLVVFDFVFCSSCATHDDCSGDALCSVTIDITTISGHWSCIPPGSVEIGGTCDPDGDGDLACASGNCAHANIDNLGFMGLCSECDEDSDCAEGFHCQPADIKTANVVAVPATCVSD